MSLEDVERRLSGACSGYWLRELRQLLTALTNEPVPLSADTVPEILERCKAHALRNERGRAANWLAVALLTDEAKTVVWLTREGLLRASKYAFNPSIPLDLVEQIRTANLELSPRTRELLGSSHNLLMFSRRARVDFDRLLAQVRQEPYTFARSCLITIDLLFMTESFPDLPFGLPWAIEPYSKEDLAEGFSFLWSHVHQQLGISRMTAGFWETEGIYIGRYLECLKVAAALRELSEAEVLIETFEYKCELVNDGCLTAIMSPPHDDLEKSIRLGFVDAEMRQARLVAEAQGIQATSLRRVGEQAHAALSANGLITTIQEGIPRVRFEFPVLPAVRDMIRSDRAFREELPEAVTVYEDYGLTPAAADDYRIGTHLTLGGIRRVQRLAAITAACVATELSRRRDEHAILVNSVSPIFQQDDALDAFLGIALEPNACVEFRNLFCWPPTAADSPTGFDVQYRPLLEAQHEWHVPMSILAASKLSRAALMLTGRRPGAEDDLIEPQLVRECLAAGAQAVSRLKLRAGDTVVGEIDVAALIDDVLVILECKNSLLACNLFELRTSYDHCKKAAIQLDRVSDALRDQDHLNTVLARLGALGRPVARVATGIVVSNRLFAGLRIGGHSVVTLGHLLRFVAQGDIVIAEHTGRARPAGRVTGQAIAEFLDGAFYQRMFGAMTPITHTVSCGGANLRFMTYALDMVELGRQFGIEIDIDELRTAEATSGDDRTHSD